MLRACDRRLAATVINLGTNASMTVTDVEMQPSPTRESNADAAARARRAAVKQARDSTEELAGTLSLVATERGCGRRAIEDTTTGPNAWKRQAAMAASFLALILTATSGWIHVTRGHLAHPDLSRAGMVAPAGGAFVTAAAAETVVIGRHQRTADGGVRFDYSGVTVTATARGTSWLGVRLSRHGAAENALRLTVDGARSVRIETAAWPEDEPVVIRLYDAPSGGPHTAALMKITEPMGDAPRSSIVGGGFVTVHGFEADARVVFESPPRSERRVEFLGDSISAGYCNRCDCAPWCLPPGPQPAWASPLPGSLEDSSGAEGQDFGLAWPSVACAALGAECHTEAWSGAPLVSSALRPLAGWDLWRRTLGSAGTGGARGGGNAWEPAAADAARAPHAVVINLGTNDVFVGQLPSEQMLDGDQAQAQIYRFNSTCARPHKARCGPRLIPELRYPGELTASRATTLPTQVRAPRRRRRSGLPGRGLLPRVRPDVGGLLPADRVAHRQAEREGRRGAQPRPAAARRARRAQVPVRVLPPPRQPRARGNGGGRGGLRGGEARLAVGGLRCRRCERTFWKSPATAREIESSRGLEYRCYR